MGNLIYPIVFSVIVGVFGLTFHYGGMILLILIILFLLYLLFAFFANIIKYTFKKQLLNKKHFVFPLTIIFLLIIFYVMLVFSLQQPTPSLDTKQNLSERLNYLVKTDQKDRSSLYFIFNPNRDRLRINYVYHMIESKKSLNAEDKYNAAIILQHGNSAKDFQTAFKLSKAAYDEGLQKAEWLSKATYDRWQISKGKPQKYNTQTNIEF